jgi:hypothetical protein
MILRNIIQKHKIIKKLMTHKIKIHQEITIFHTLSHPRLSFNNNSEFINYNLMY